LPCGAGNRIAKRALPAPRGGTFPAEKRQPKAFVARVLIGQQPQHDPLLAHGRLQRVQHRSAFKEQAAGFGAQRTATNDSRPVAAGHDKVRGGLIAPIELSGRETKSSKFPKWPMSPSPDFEHPRRGRIFNCFRADNFDASADSSASHPRRFDCAAKSFLQSGESSSRASALISDSDFTSAET
jgi:hypothetical protein